MGTRLSFEGISYNLTCQALYCILGFCSAFLLKYSFQSLGIRGTSGKVSRLEARNFAVYLALRVCSCDNGLFFKL